MKKREVIDGKQECIGCHQWLPLDSFHKHCNSSTGRAWRCKECHKKTPLGGKTPSQRAQDWAKRNPERFKQLSDESRRRVINDVRRLKRRRERTRAYYYRSKAIVVSSHSNWKKNNPWAMIADRLRSKIRYTVNSFQIGSQSFKDLTGLNANQFRAYLQSKWLPGMSWANFGRDGWTIGHIIPVAHFKSQLHTTTGQKECFHYSNLLPEWQHSNNAKHTRTHLTNAQSILEQEHPVPTTLPKHTRTFPIP